MTKQDGFYEKYSRIDRTDGEHRPGGKHHDCRYFVLDLDHDKYAAPALMAYAEACARDLPILARDLLGWAREIEGRCSRETLGGG